MSVHDAILEEFVDCSVMEKDNFADIQLDKTDLSEESLHQSRDMHQDKSPKEFKFRWYFFQQQFFLSSLMDSNGTGKIEV